MPLYTDRDPRKLEPYFSQHMMAMTAEQLFGKAEIAQELAFRDQQIAELKKQLEFLTDTVPIVWIDTDGELCCEVTKGKPIATTLGSDPYDERAGVRFSLEDWAK